MTEFKPGDKVISPLLVGEWEVMSEATAVTVNIAQDGLGLEVPGDILTLVAPPLPPEPPVGTVGFVDGRPIISHSSGWYIPSTGSPVFVWAEIADRFVPAVPKPTVEEMAEALYGSDVEGITAAERARIIMCELGWEVPE